MDTHDHTQRITSHLKGFPVKDYFVGQDIGTSSVGWAVTDTAYKLLKFRSHKMWGSRLFDEGQTAVATRGFRAARRRLRRRKFRLALLEELFAAPMGAVDPTFFMRLHESKYHYEDKSESTKYKHILFVEDSYTDQDYFKEFPTIYHLRAHLMKHGTDDIRKLFLAIHHIIKYRGNFLYEGATFDSTNGLDTTLQIALQRISFGHTDCESILQPMLAVLQTDGLTKSDKVKQIEALASNGNTKKESTQDEEPAINDKKRLKAFAQLILGLSARLDDLFGTIEGLEPEMAKMQISGDTYDDKREEYAKVWGDMIYTIDDCKAVYDAIILMSIKEQDLTLSESKVKSYTNHQEDLVVLKRLLKPDRKAYYEMFKADKKGLHNYVLYIKQGRTEATSCSQEEFYKYVGNVIKSLLESSDSQIQEDKQYIEAKIGLQSLLPLQRVKDNGVIPYQLHKEELVAILDKAKENFPFLNALSDGFTVAEKIVKLLEFRIPYYVGPLNNHHSVKDGGFAWVVRKSEGRVLPWNFDEKIDEIASAEAFITNITNKCTYLMGEDVVPKQSLLYSEFSLLNELNNIRIDGKPLAIDVKENLITDIFKSDHKKMTKGRIGQFLMDNNYVTNKPEITGIDVDIKSDLASYRDMERILGVGFNYDMAERIIRYITLFGESKKMLKATLHREFGQFIDEEQINKLAKLRYRDWGRLSKNFLNGIEGCELSGDGEPMTIIEAMRRTEYNLMQLLSDQFSFMECITDENNQVMGATAQTPLEMIEEMALSPAVKRSVWQALRILDEIILIKKGIPKRIFIEVARSNKNEKKKKDSRKQRLLELYKSIKGEEKDWVKAIENTEDTRFNSKKLYLYYTQMGKCMYSGRPIDLEELHSDKYDIDHIYPRSLTKDDSFDNLVLCEKPENAKKSDKYPIAEDVRMAQKSHWDYLLRAGLISEKKYNRLVRREELTVDDLSQFVARQLVETNQAVKAVTTILKQLYPDTDVVYVKAENVSDFRHANDFIKVRSLNHHHHAKDAYLNIVVGNVYHEKFTRNFRSFIANNGMNRSYNLVKIFDRDIMMAGSKTVKAWDAEHSMDTVRKMMASNDVRVTKRLLEQKGALYKATVHKASRARKASDSIYLGMKTKDIALSDVSKYGGVSDIRNAYSMIVTYKDKKGKTICEVIPIPIYLIGRLTGKNVLLEYAEMMLKNAKDICIVRNKICINQLVRINGFYYYFGGKSNERIYIDSAISLVVENDIERYIKLLDKFYRLKVDNSSISASTISTGDKNKNTYCFLNLESNMKVFDYLVKKLKCGIFSKMKGNKVIDLSETGKVKFINMDLDQQCILLLEILNLLTHFKTVYSGVKELGFTASRPTIGVKLSSLDEFVIVDESITGLYSNEIKII